MAEPLSTEAARPRLVLASASPRRQDLLARLVPEFEVIPAAVDESAAGGELPEGYVARLAREKAESVAAGHPDAVILAADTTVVLDGLIIGKPVGTTEARSILARLSGRTHTVLTGVAVVSCAGGPRLGPALSEHVESTSVEFGELSSAAIDHYVATGEPMGKAGAYAIQGSGAALVDSIEGDPTNVIGLPLRATARLLVASGLSCWVT